MCQQELPVTKVFNISANISSNNPPAAQSLIQGSCASITVDCIVCLSDHSDFRWYVIKKYSKAINVKEGA